MTARVVLTTRDVTSEGSRPAALDGRQDFYLAKAHVPPVGITPRRTVVAEDIRDLQS